MLQYHGGTNFVRQAKVHSLPTVMTTMCLLTNMVCKCFPRQILFCTERVQVLFFFFFVGEGGGFYAPGLFSTEKLVWFNYPFIIRKVRNHCKSIFGHFWYSVPYCFIFGTLCLLDCGLAHLVKWLVLY